MTDQTGRSASWQARVIVGNQAPRVPLTVVSTTPPFNFGDTVNYTVTITDDQPVDCARVSVAYILGHETHGHPQTSTAGCTGTISVPLDTGHAGASNLSAVFVAQYTDNPGGGETPQQGSAEVRLVPARCPRPARASPPLVRASPPAAPSHSITSVRRATWPSSSMT